MGVSFCCSKKKILKSLPLLQAVVSARRIMIFLQVAKLLLQKSLLAADPLDSMSVTEFPR